MTETDIAIIGADKAYAIVRDAISQLTYVLGTSIPIVTKLEQALALLSHANKIIEKAHGKATPLCGCMNLN